MVPDLEPDMVAIDLEPDMVALDFDTFFRAESPRLARLAIALCGSPAEAEELAQEVMLRCLQRWRRVSGLESPGGWCRRVLLHLVFSRTRRLRHEASTLIRLGARSSRHPADDVIDVIEADAFWSAVRSLPAAMARVIALYYVDDLSIAEIACLTGRAEGTVRSQLHQARERLAVTLKVKEEPS